MATLQEIGDALQNAHAAGDTAAAQQLADAYASMQGQAPQAYPSDTAATDPLAQSMPNPAAQPARTVRDQIQRTMNTPGTLPGIPTQDFASGVGMSALTGGVGQFGDIESLARLPLSLLGVPGRSLLPTTNRVDNAVFGPAKNEKEQSGRNVGGMASPLLLKGLWDALPARTPPSGPIAQAASDARGSGYVIPPTMASEKPSALTTVLSGLGGKVKTQQLASTKNATAGTAAVAQDLGLPEGTMPTPDVLEGIRATAGKAYEAAKKAPIEVLPNQAFHDRIDQLNQAGSAARNEFPELTGNPEVDNLVSALKGKDKFSPDAAVDLVRSLRYKAQTNLKNFTSPEKMDLGRAQSKAASAVEQLLEDNLKAATTARAPTGAQGGDMNSLVDALQKARVTIAKSYTAEDAANPVTGVINPRVFANAKAKGVPLTGPMADLANAATAFPKAFQNPATFGGNEPLSVLDIAFALSSKAGAAVLGRPAARHLLLSKLYQNASIPRAAAAPAAQPAQSALSSPIIRALLAQQALTAATASQLQH